MSAAKSYCEVWRAHKLACGQGDPTSSKPFVFPALTTAEYNDAIARLETPIPSQYGETFLAKEAWELAALPTPMDLITRMRTPAEGDDATRYKSWVIAVCRATDQTRKAYDLPRTAAEEKAEILRVFSGMLILVYRPLRAMDYLPHDPTEVQNHHLLCHKLFLLAKLWLLADADEAQYGAYYASAKERFEVWIQDGFGADDQRFRFPLSKFVLRREKDQYFVRK
ncbi:hypothetical protein JCM10908_004784 [Rhodotorula pacifica]|uniref:uncharacterized protein n=1 Tax=Rhodotorula pacifica TaxID=1495444 RepID=UPI003171FA71